MKLQIDEFIIYLTQSNDKNEDERYVQAFFPFNGDIEKYNKIKRIFGELYTCLYKTLYNHGQMMLVLKAKTELEVIDKVRARGFGVKQLPNIQKLR